MSDWHDESRSWKVDGVLKSVFTGFDRRAPTSLYRHIPLVQLISLLEDGALSLIDPKTWPDKTEAGWISSIFGHGSPLEGAFARAVCFTREAYCEALWHVYDRMSPVVRVRFNVAELLKGARAVSRAHGKFYFGDVRYGNSKEMHSAYVQASSGKFVASDAAHLLLMKRRAFSYEEEVRAVLVTRNKVDNVLSMPVPHKAITQVLVSPYADNWILKAIQDLLQNRYRLECEVQRSSLDRAPKWMSESASFP